MDTDFALNAPAPVQATDPFPDLSPTRKEGNAFSAIEFGSDSGHALAKQARGFQVARQHFAWCSV